MKKIALIMLVLLIAACSKDEIIIKKHGTVLDTVKVEHIKNLRDLNTQIVYDTIRNVYYDTIRNLVNDTTHTTKYDTVTVHTTQIKYDTIWAYDTKIKYDTIKVKVNDTVYTHITVKDTVWAYETEIKYDTIKVKVNDTVWTYQTETRYETTHVVVKDTIHVTINDTIRIIINPTIHYTLRYVINPISGEDEIIPIEKGESATLKSDAEREGYTFLQWNTQADGSGEAYNAGEEIIVTNDMVFYGIWKSNNGIRLNELADYLSTIPFGETVDIKIIDLNPDIKKLNTILGNYQSININLDLEDCINLKTLGGKFDGRKNLISIKLPLYLTSIDYTTFWRCENLTSVTIHEGVKVIDRDCFGYCSSLTSIEIPSTVTTIGARAFNLCSSLSSVTLKPRKVNIDENVFASTAISSITLPNGITEIKKGTFSGCAELTEIILPQSITTICYGAFTGCTKLTTITIPENINELQGNLFEYDTQLKSVKIESTVPPTVEATTFPSTVEVIYVPASAVEKYKNASMWKDCYANLIVGY